MAWCKKCGKQIESSDKNRMCDRCRTERTESFKGILHKIASQLNNFAIGAKAIDYSINTLNGIQNTIVGISNYKNMTEQYKIQKRIIDDAAIETKPFTITERKPYYCVEFKDRYTGQWKTTTFTENKGGAYSTAKLDHHGRATRIVEGVSNTIIFEKPEDPSFR